jgi:hypothetical protein
MTEKKNASKPVTPSSGRTGVVNESARTQKSFTTNHNRDKIGKPKPNGGNGQ